MAILALGGSDAEDKEQGYSAYLNATIRSLEAKEKFPGLIGSSHIDTVQEVKAEVASFTGFVRKSRAKSDNLYQNEREKLGGDVSGPGTALKFIFDGQRNFTSKDGQDLHAHLQATFPNVKLNVRFGGGKPRCVVHVGL